MRSFAGLSMPLGLAVVALRASAPAPSPTSADGEFETAARLARVQANDNRTPAGTLRNGVLTLTLEAHEAVWHPDADSAPGMRIQAFAEPAKLPTIPGPLIRVPAGTEVRVTVSNKIAGSTLQVHGLHARPVSGHSAGDTMTVPAGGGMREARFRLESPGTYMYWATTSNAPLHRRSRIDSQLSGAIVVDDASTGTPPRDRIFVISEWADSLEPGGGPVEGTLLVTAINGRSWPHTERLRHAVGDTVRWRWVNASPANHPMHLHGFYFRVDSHGDAQRDTVYAERARPRAVTELIPIGGTMAITWVPKRPGNWLFHCHVPVHFQPHLPLDRSAPRARHDGAHVRNHALEGMNGLVMGIHVRARGVGPAQVGAAPPRRLRLAARVDSGGTPADPHYGFALTDAGGRTAREVGLVPGPVLVLRPRCTGTGSSSRATSMGSPASAEVPHASRR